MRILLYGINYAPELTGIGKYTGEMAEWLSSKGHDVQVVTAPPYYPAWKIGKGYSAWKYGIEEINGVRVTRCPIWVPENQSGAKRILHLISFALSSMPATVINSLFWRPDIIFAVEPPFFCAPTAWLSARVCGARACLHIQDFEIDAAFDLGLIRSSFLRRIAFNAEKWFTRRFDMVSTISERMFTKLLEKGLDKKRAVLFPNWVDTGLIYPLDEPSPMRKELNIPDNTIVLLYSGNMGEKQGLDIIIKVAQLLVDEKNLLFILCGDGAAKERLVKSAQGLKNVRFIPLQPFKRLNELLNLADVHLLPQRPDVEDLVMPSKLIGMFSSGRPVIATASPGTQVAMAVEGCGIVVLPGNPELLATAILHLAINLNERVQYGLNARAKAVAQWGRDDVLGHFEELLFRI